MKTKKIYLAGKVPKGSDEKDVLDWRCQYYETLENIDFLTPINDGLDYSKPEIVFGHDCFLIEESDAIIVDASRKLGAGTAQEMVIAKYYNRYVFTVLPKDTHHRRPMLNFDGESIVDDWIHPFVYASSDRIFISHDECIDYVKGAEFLRSLQYSPKGISYIDDARASYLKSAENEE